VVISQNEVSVGAQYGHFSDMQTNQLLSQVENIQQGGKMSDQEVEPFKTPLDNPHSVKPRSQQKNMEPIRLICVAR
jgi:hypothetical protein